MSIWSMDIESNKITNSVNITEILGVAPDNFDYTYQAILEGF